MPDFDLYGESLAQTLVHASLTQPLFVQELFADKNAEQRATERKWTELNDEAVTVGTRRGAGAEPRERKTHLSAGKPRSDNFQQTGRNEAFGNAKLPCGAKSLHANNAEMSAI